MPDDVFRGIVAVAAILASLAFIGQIIILAVLFREGKKAQRAGKEIHGKLGPMIERCQDILDTTTRILAENRPKVAEIVTETSAISKTAHREVDRISELIDDVNARARTRIAQVDHVMDETIVQVEQVSETVKSAVLRPAREVNGIVNGVKAAMSSYAEGRRRPSVDHVTQDEEMFI